MTQKILFTSQNFGFGPGSKAGTVANSLKNLQAECQVDFFGDGISYDLAQSKASIYHNVYFGESCSDLEKRIIGGNYSSVVSIMNPNSILVSDKLGVPSIYVDSLAWFWNWERLLQNEKKEDFKDKLEKMSFLEKQSLLKNFHPHESQLVGHLLANKSFIQTYPNISEDSKNVVYLGIDAQRVGPIVDRSSFVRDEKETRLLITLCGQLNPIVSLENTVEYGKFVLSLLDVGLQAFYEESNIQVELVGHKDILSLIEQSNYLKEKNLEFVKVSHKSHKEYYDSINQSVAVIGPASITTMYEALMYEKPFIFLPEQHDGHYPNYRKITDPINLEKVPQVFPGIMLSPTFEELVNVEEENISHLYSVIRNFENKEFIFQKDRYRKAYLEILEKVSDREYRKNLIELQKFSLTNQILLEDGGRTIAKYILTQNGQA